MDYKATIQCFTEMSKETLLQWLMMKSLIRQSCKCIHCDSDMKLRKSKSCLDGFEWRCHYSNCPHRDTTKSIRAGSFFENIKVEMIKIIQILIYWSADLQQVHILRLVKVTKPTFMKLKRLLQHKIKYYFEANPIKLGGLNTYCQIDEIKMDATIKKQEEHEIVVKTEPESEIQTEIKSEIKIEVKSEWCYIIVDTSFTPAHGYCEIIPDKKPSTLIPVIESAVSPGTILWSNAWSNYPPNRLKNHPEFPFNSIYDKYNFTSLSKNTLHAESFQTYIDKLKAKIKAMKGIKMEERTHFLQEFMFKERHNQSETNSNNFDATIKLIKIQ